MSSQAPLYHKTRPVTWRVSSLVTIQLSLFSSQDVQMILPTLVILLITLIIMLTVIPYAFSTVFKQMEAIRALESLQDTNSGEGLDLGNTPNSTEDL